MDENALKPTCQIRVNGNEEIYLLVSYMSYIASTGTGSGVLRLKRGDRVNVGGCTYPDSLQLLDVLNSFSGILIKADV